MDNKIDKYFELHGFVRDGNKELLNKIFNSKKIKEIHVDTYMENPYRLFARFTGENLSIINKDNRVAIFKNDKYKTMMVNILFNEIEDCFIKQYSDNHHEILFKVCNVCYKILIIV